jgi:hypothetical protein
MVLTDDVFVWISNTAAVLDIITVAVAAFGVFQIWRLRRTYRKRLDALAQTRSRRPVAIAIGIGGGGTGDIMEAVKTSLQDHGLGDIETFPISRPGLVTPEEMLKVRDELLELKARLGAATEVHYFYKGPVPLTTAFGAILDNWAPATLYAYEDGTYRPVIYLNKQFTVGKSALKFSKKKS